MRSSSLLFLVACFGVALLQITAARIAPAETRLRRQAEETEDEATSQVARADDVIVFQDEPAESDIAELEKLTEAKSCGINGKKIAQIKGEGVSSVKDWPWVAAIIRKTDKFQFCGGAILTRKHILTAAHCVPGVDPKKIQVRVGEYDFTRNNDSYHQDLDVKEIYSHKSFDAANYEHDIAMLILDQEIEYNFYAQPICLPPPGPRYENMTCIVAGWGALGYGGPKSDVLMEVPVPTWDHQKCISAYVQTIFDTNVCAAAYEGGKDSCQGDSGGPLLCQLDNSNKWSTIGIVSWGIRCGVRNKPGVYTRVNSYLPWIAKHLKIK